LLLASAAGYRVAGAALAPVERMRARASAIGGDDSDERLPEPGSRDEIGRLAGTLNELLDRLHGAIAHERRVVSDASHELRTPISVLRMRVDVALRSGSRDGEELHEVLVETKRDADRLTRLADDLLLLARADQGRVPLRRELTEVWDELRAAAGRHREAVELAGRSITVRSEIDGAAVIEADPDRIHQILDNLIANSLRHGAGEIRLVTRGIGGDRVAMLIEDDGHGFPDGFAASAFDRFSQGDTSRGASGSGLGLAIVAALARAHSWTVAAANTASGGAQVTVTAPLA
jgi:signal transduction histidine kinase